MDDHYESVLLVIKECSVFRIPPRASAKGFKAADWDTDAFMWKGRLRIIAKGDECFINLEDATTGDLFAACPYPPDGSTVEPVLDSSRYFVLTLVDKASGRKAFIGMGFTERSHAFDFNVALQDHAKRVNNLNQPPPKPSAAKQSAMDFSLKEDQKFSINIGGIGSKKKDASTTGSSDFTFLPPPPSSNTAHPFLPPPPQSSSSSHGQPSLATTPNPSNDPFAFLAAQSNLNTPSAQKLAVSNDDWANFGDFQTSANAGDKDKNGAGGWATFD
ncbi:adaptin ear-binding coat-associated protein 2 [Chytriomyces cf. hyalinus JEL632]|nr:adaptin ear-binding coat-associated protein 2 [Chytriomyces cf. hyalinus JEL632]